MNNTDYRPREQGARIDSLDVIRGFAVMGILFMNVQSFSMPDAAYLNPAAFGNLSGLNGVCWVAIHILVSQKFASLFALLFGAGIYLFMRPGADGIGKPLTLHYRRMFWLLLFGLAHFYLLWWGDVLMIYAIGGCFAILLRNQSSRVLLVASFLFLVLGVLAEVDFFERAFDLTSAADFADVWLPPAADLNDEVELYRSGWWEQVSARSEVMAGYFSYGALTAAYVGVLVARATGLMLMGMLLFRSGYLLAQRSVSDYCRLAVFALVPGLALTVINLLINVRGGFTAEYNFFWGRFIDYWASILMALGYIGVFYLALQAGYWPAARARLQAAGKLAFTNYLSQTLIGTSIFYGFGLGWFGQTDRANEMLIAVAIIALQLWWSPLVLKYCNFGPMEWLWRSLTYWRWQPLGRQRPLSVGISK